MKKNGTVKDIMVDVFDFPHIPYWFTIKQAMGIIKKAFIEPEKCFHPMAILIFDEKYNLMGTVTLEDILRGLEPKLLKSGIMTEYEGADIEQALATYEASMFNEASRIQAEAQVRDIMIPAKIFVDANDSIVKAAFLMIHNNLSLLPVLEDRKKLVGIIKLLDVYKEISNKFI